MLLRHKAAFKIIRDIFSNIFFSKRYDIFYVVEGVDWVVYWVGKYITENLNERGLARIKMTTTHIGLRNKLIHFGSVNTLVSQKGIRKVHSSNKAILTWFHISPNDKRVKYIRDLNNNVSMVHTSCKLTKEKLISHGLSGDKAIVVPLGVDLNVFKPCSDKKKRETKKKLGIPENKIIIGSFQKDGEGWEEGLEPKKIKGPDVFCGVVENLSQKYPLHILLTGPARGYVKNKLEKSNIGYTHKFLKNYPDIVDFYNVLDLYLVTSREEGGPQSILESMACGVPIISTPVGMAPDVLMDDLKFLIVEQNNLTDLCAKAENILNDTGLREKMIHAELKRAKKYDWKIIADEYYNKIYSKFIT